MHTNIQLTELLTLASSSDTSGNAWVQLAYLVAAVMLLLGLKKLGSVKTAVRGNTISAMGMLLACALTFFLMNKGEAISLVWIGIAILIGTAAGLWLAVKTPMTGMPQMVGLLNGFGGIASLLVAVGDFSRNFGDHQQTAELRNTITDPGELTTALASAGLPTQGVWLTLLAIGLASLIGGITFTGSLVAFGKLQGLKWTPTKPIQFPGQKLIIAALLLLSLIMAAVLVVVPDAWWAVALITVFSLVLGVLLVIGIGGGDMPVVVSLLNSYSGLAASMAGFVLQNHLLIITGSLVGASGLILTTIMCKAMNRSLMNVLFGGVGATVKKSAGSGDEVDRTVREMTAEDVAIQLEAAGMVIIVPGYGMAVAQAQHAVAGLYELLDQRGIACRFAIHPVAGRMPGHMNVLLAEANLPYESLCDLETINPQFEQAGVAIVLGANDVVNPAARHDESSPIFGMPILDVDKANSVIVIKRSLNPGFAGIENELFFKQNTGMLFGDGKAMITEIAKELKDM